MYKLIVTITLFQLLTILNAFPISSNCINLENSLHGIPMEKDMSPDNKYPQPEYIVPLITHDDKGIHMTVPKPEKCGHVGYAHAGNIEGKLMPMDEFSQHFNLPDNVSYKDVKCGRVLYASEPIQEDLTSCS